MRRLESSPRKDNFRMPAEFERHRCTYMIWPERGDLWRYGGKLVQVNFVEIAEIIARYEPVIVLVNQTQYANARHMLPDNIRVIEMTSDGALIRDTGPTCVINKEGEVRGIDWEFNAWGGMVNGVYHPWDKDDQIAQKICELESLDSYRLDSFILEGSAILTDGDGTLIVTEENLLSEGKNTQFPKVLIEQMLKEYLNVEKIIWLKCGLYGDGKHGSVENVVNFVRPGELVIAWTNDSTDRQYKISQEILKTLENETDARGRAFKIHKLPIPEPMYVTEKDIEGLDKNKETRQKTVGDRLAASYTNYYMCNGGVIFPLFDDPMDEYVQDTFTRIFPTYDVMGVCSKELLLGQGNIRSITLQIPE